MSFLSYAVNSVLLFFFFYYDIKSLFVCFLLVVHVAALGKEFILFWFCFFGGGSFTASNLMPLECVLITFFYQREKTIEALSSFPLHAQVI